MFTKTTLFKVIFVVAILGVLGLAAIAPSAARAFFDNQGVIGFSNRWVEHQVVTGTHRSFDSLAVAKPVTLSQTGASAPAAIADASANSSSGEGQYLLTGTLTAKNGNIWTVEGVTVMVSSATQLSGTLEIGSMVKVEGMLQTDGSILAQRIEPVIVDPNPGTGSGNPPAGNPMELTGTLTAIDGMNWTVDGVTVVISATTEVSGTPQVGMLVKVEGTLQADGTILASEIKPATEGENGDHQDGENEDNEHQDGEDEDGEHQDGQEMEFSGVVTAMNGTTWTVDDKIVTVSPDTELKGTFIIGAMVKVEGTLLADGTVQAHEIKAVSDTGAGTQNGSNDHSGSDGSHSSGDDDDHSGGDSNHSGGDGSHNGGDDEHNGGDHDD